MQSFLEILRSLEGRFLSEAVLRLVLAAHIASLGESDPS